MKKRIRMPNPFTMINPSSPMIDRLFEERDEVIRDMVALKSVYEKTLKYLNEAENKKIQSEFKVLKKRLSKINGDIIYYFDTYQDKIRKRLNSIKNSPILSGRRHDIVTADRLLASIYSEIHMPEPELDRVKDNIIDAISIVKLLEKKISDEKSTRSSMEVMLHIWKHTRPRAVKFDALKNRVKFIDTQIDNIKSKLRKGHNQNLEMIRLEKAIDELSEATKPYVGKKSGTALKPRPLSAAVADLSKYKSDLVRMGKDGMSQGQGDKMKLRLEDISRKFSIYDKESWPKSGRDAFYSEIRSLRKAVSKMTRDSSRKGNPCLPRGFRKRNASDILDAIEVADNPKDLISKCEVLCEQYRAKPGKTKLKSLISHLEKMKKSKSPKVKSKRASSLRMANREAKKIGLR